MPIIPHYPYLPELFTLNVVLTILIVNGSAKIFIFMRQEDASLKWDSYVFCNFRFMIIRY